MRRSPRFLIAVLLIGVASALASLGPGPDGISSARADPSSTPSDASVRAFYRDELLHLQRAGIGREGRLGDLLAPLFATAAERSRELDPVLENRALLGMLASWAGGGDGQAADYRLTLAGRRDLARHFLVSAALAARGETTLSHLVGLIKEISDADGGSGFSFADIAADRAGARFGEVATRSPAHARELQGRVAVGVADEQLLPPVGDLPERLDRETLFKRFGGPGGDAYRELVAEIDRRIAALALYAR